MPKIKDSWKPWYWTTPSYSGASLKEALFKAYDDGLEGKNIIYDGEAKKVKLNENDLSEYYMTRVDKRPRMQRILPNTSRTPEASTDRENSILNIQKGLMEHSLNLGNPSEDYYIPYLYDKEITLPYVGRISSNMLDSIAVNAKRAGLPMRRAIGLTALETKMGNIPNYSLDALKKRYKENYGKEMPEDEQRAIERAAHNSSFARNHGGIYPQFFTNDHEWSTRGWEKVDKYKKVLSNIASPMEHAFTLEKMGLYNTKEKDRRAKINKAADMVMSSPTYKKWERTYKNK